MPSYHTGRAICGFFEIVAWCAIAIGVIVVLGGLDAVSNRGLMASAGVLALAPGLVITFLGLLVVLLAQLARASMDTADMTGEMLQLSRRQFELANTSFNHQKKIHPLHTTDRSETAAHYPEKHADGGSGAAEGHVG